MEREPFTGFPGAEGPEVLTSTGGDVGVELVFDPAEGLPAHGDVHVDLGQGTLPQQHSTTGGGEAREA